MLHVVAIVLERCLALFDQGLVLLMPLKNPLKKLVDEVEDTLRNLLSLLRFAALHHLAGRLHQLSIELSHDLCEPNPQFRLAHNEVN